MAEEDISHRWGVIQLLSKEGLQGLPWQIQEEGGRNVRDGEGSCHSEPQR